MLKPTTELQAVNTVLDYIEELPLRTLSGELDPDASAALDVIREASRSVQTRGWEFNTEPSFILRVSPDGTIPVPENVIRVSAPGKRYATRAGKLFDRDEQSIIFAADVEASVITLLDFSDLPQEARDYIFLVAAWKFLTRRAPDALMGRMTQVDIDNARIDLNAADIRAAGASFSPAPAIAQRPRLQG